MGGRETDMDVERYPGERRGLTLFLHGLLPVVKQMMGTDALLYHRVDRALESGSLRALRAARQMFNMQPRDLKHRLSQGLCAPQAPSKANLLDDYSHREPTPFVRFDAQTGPHALGEEPTVEFSHELLDSASLRVLVRPGTLPSDAARGLRRIAALIERDRRLLSSRHWHNQNCDPAPDGDDSADWA